MNRPLEPTAPELADGSALSQRRRLDAIRRLQLLERAGDPQLNAIARLARHVTGADAAAIHVLDDRWQHRIGGAGAVPEQTRHPAADSMCRQVVDSGRAIITADAPAERRFVDSPFVQGEQPVRFYASLPLRLADGSVLGTVCAFDNEPIALSVEQQALLEDVAHQAAAYVELLRVATELSEIAVLDPLTGALNQVVFHDRLADTLARRGPGAHIAVAVLDVDHFKALNDTYGHSTGDRVLRGLVDRVCQVAGDDGLVGRLGGDEFAVVIRTDEATPYRLRRELARVLAPESWPREPRPAVTVGAVIAWPNEDARAVIHRADETMYAVKRRRGSLRDAA